jgi:hypothetical protein
MEKNCQSNGKKILNSYKIQSRIMIVCYWSKKEEWSNHIIKKINLDKKGNIFLKIKKTIILMKIYLILIFKNSKNLRKNKK